MIEDPMGLEEFDAVLPGDEPIQVILEDAYAFEDDPNRPEQQEVDAYSIDDDEFVKARRAARASTAAVQPDDQPVQEFDGLTEQIVQTVPVWQGAFLTAESVSVRLPNGRMANRDVLRHPGAVAVVAITDDGKIVLVHQYRTALEQVLVEIPAGKLELGEDPAAAAARELLEETGYLSDRMAYLGGFACAPGYSDEVIHLFMAMGLHFQGACPDADEFLQVDLVDLTQMVDAVLDGKVTDSKTAIAVLLCDAISRRM